MTQEDLKEELSLIEFYVPVQFETGFSDIDIDLPGEVIEKIMRLTKSYARSLLLSKEEIEEMDKMQREIFNNETLLIGIKTGIVSANKAIENKINGKR